jgi:outer membrane receptor protein involved in Fe transport
MPKTTEPVYLFLEDGVPTRSTGFFNHNALYEVDLPHAGRIEVLKGPATALYGSDAIGGVIDVETRAPTRRPAAQAYAEGGHNGWSRALLSASGTHGSHGLRAALNLTRTDGWRDGTGYERQSGTLRWDHSLPRGLLKTVISFSRIDQETAGSSALLRDDYLGDRTINYTPISLRNVRAIRVSSALDVLVGETRLSLTPFLRWNEMELLPNWSLTYDPTIYTTGHRSAGLLLRASRELGPLRSRIIAGADADYSPGGREEFRIDPVREGRMFTAYSVAEPLYDYDVTYRSISPYLQLETNPIDRLHVTAGLRYDRMAYDYGTHLDAIATGRWRRPPDARIAYEHLSPKLGVIYEFGAGLAAYANYVHGFRVPSEGQLFRQGSAANTVGLQPVVANSFEVGARGETFGRIGYTFAAYRMEVGNDILTYIRPDGIRETQNAGRTLHRGLEAGLGMAVAPRLRADVAWSLAQHSYLEWRPAAEVDYRGNEQESAPNVLASARVAYSPRLLGSGQVAAEWTHVGRYWMDAENSHRYPGHDLYSISSSLPVGRHLTVIARMMNVTDERFAESASYTQARGEEFAPGLPRTVYVGLQYGWGGDGR